MNEVLSVLTGVEVNDPSAVIEQAWAGADINTTGYIIKSQVVNSICDGTVIAVERDPKDNTWSVTIEINSQKWIRYCNLSATLMITGRDVTRFTIIGYANSGLMRLEYCTSAKSAFPVRIGKRQLYKQDPAPIIFGQETLSEVF